MPEALNLFSPLQLREVILRNRISVSPMCEYSSEDGFANDWHMVHLGSRAVGGAGMVITEATAVVPEGRISPHDLGIWKDEHIDLLLNITNFIQAEGAVPGIQLAHAGRKASTRRPWEGYGIATPEDGGWTRVVAPSAIPFSETYLTPVALTVEEIAEVVAAFRAAAVRSLKAGFQIIELHGAHGYLMHQFLSPLSNHRTDSYGGSFENRTRIVREIVTATREVWPDDLPLALRLSASDWVEGGWSIAETVQLAKDVQALGVDLVDCSSGGAVLGAQIPVGPGYQVPFAKAVHEAGVLSAAVGMITEPAQANDIIVNGEADVVMLARELLRDPYWPLHAAKALGIDVAWPDQYVRAKL